MSQTPVVPIDLGIVVNNTEQTLVNLTNLLSELSSNPKPAYSVHGHDFDWVGLYKFVSGEIDACRKRLSQLQPFEYVHAAR